jgi:dTDP-4-dehydrorhamnose reductase
MKILVTGSNGQLGKAIRTEAPQFPEHEFLFTDVDELDITSRQALKAFFERNTVNVIINCAAYTAVDRAEQDHEAALLLNGTAVGQLARASFSQNPLIIHISTDFVFDGNKRSPYLESDLPSPLSVYGKTKLKGEIELATHAGRGLILRTSWLYYHEGRNFVRTILDKAGAGSALRVVDDQTGCPTYAGDLATAILTLLPAAIKMPGVNVFHYCNEGETTRYGFASAICHIGRKPCEIIPVKTADYPQQAMRPSYSVMSREKFKRTFHLSIPHWEESLSTCLLRMQ